MDPITLIIVTALANGAAAGLKPTAEQAVKDAYNGVKALIQRKYAKVNLAPLESKPQSKDMQEWVGTSLQDAGAHTDKELQESVSALLEAIKKHAPETPPSIGFTLEDLEAGNVKIKSLIAEGNVNLELRRAKLRGDIDLGEVQAGNVDHARNP